MGLIFFLSFEKILFWDGAPGQATTRTFLFRGNLHFLAKQSEGTTSSPRSQAAMKPTLTHEPLIG